MTVRFQHVHGELEYVIEGDEGPISAAEATAIAAIDSAKMLAQMRKILDLLSVRLDEIEADTSRIR